VTASTDRLSPATGSQAGAAAQAGSTAGGAFGSTSGGRGGGAGFGSTQSTLGSAASGANVGALDARGGTGLGGGGQSIMEGVRITADTSSNALLVYASTENYQIIERTLVQLDRPLAQVAVDATVAGQPELRRSVLSQQCLQGHTPCRIQHTNLAAGRSFGECRRACGRSAQPRISGFQFPGRRRSGPERRPRLIQEQQELTRGGIPRVGSPGRDLNGVMSLRRFGLQ